MDKIAEYEQKQEFEEVNRRVARGYALPNSTYAFYNRSDASKLASKFLNDGVESGDSAEASQEASTLAKIKANPSCKWYYTHIDGDLKPVKLNLLHPTKD